MDDSLLVDISDALSERDRVRFTVHTRTKLPQFSKQVISVVRQHEEFIWLYNCLKENKQYAGYIIPPPPLEPDFNSSREKLQRLGDCEARLKEDEFAKMKQELESEYLAIFKKTVAMHEMFLQRLASHDKFRYDNNFKIFLEYENELAVRGKTNREKIAGSLSNIGRSFADLVMTTSQVANSNSISSGIAGLSGFSISNLTNSHKVAPSVNNSSSLQANNNNVNTKSANNRNNSSNTATATSNNNSSDVSTSSSSIIDNVTDGTDLPDSTEANGSNESDVYSNELFFDKERLFIALYYDGICTTVSCAEKLVAARKKLAETYLRVAKEMVPLGNHKLLPITEQTLRDVSTSGLIAGPLPSLTLPATSNNSASVKDDKPVANSRGLSTTFVDLDEDDLSCSPQTSDGGRVARSASEGHDKKQGDIRSDSEKDRSTGGCANDHTSEGLRKLLTHVGNYFEQAKKVEARTASDEDLKLADTFRYYERETQAAKELLSERLRFMYQYETATEDLSKARLKGRTQYEEVIQKQAEENFVSITKQAKQELIDYKRRRVNHFKRAFSELAELEIKNLRAHSQLITNCLNICRGEVSAGTNVAGAPTAVIASSPSSSSSKGSN